MRFADRTDFQAENSGLERAMLAARRSGRPFLDLTVTNPTRCGFTYNEEELLRALADTRSMRYDAKPLGSDEARRAVTEAYYGVRRIPVAPEQLMLTASTSEAYGYLFRLLCNPGDEILVPQPSYPLFDLLARLHDVETVPYPLVHHDGWQVDPAALERAVTGKSRAIITVHPNNPTGHFASAIDRDVLRRVAERHGLALIADEVFLDYPVKPREPPVSFAAEPSPVLLFVLSGISKVLALPQMKLAWTAVCGPEPLRHDALHRLEIVADTFLSVGAPVQHALGHWLRSGQGIQREIRERLQANTALMVDVLSRSALVSSLEVEGGWSAVLRVPALEADTSLVMRLLQEHGVAMHPGSFYGFGQQGWLIVSLLTPTGTFAQGLGSLVKTVADMIAVNPSGT